MKLSEYTNVTDRLEPGEKCRERILAATSHTSKIKTKKMFVKYIAVVSSVLMISSLTVAGSVMYSREKALTGLEGSEYIDFLNENNINVTDIVENSHMRVYLDSIVSDGKVCRINYCCESLDRKCQELFNEVNRNNGGLLQNLFLSYSDNYELVSVLANSDENKILNDENHLYFSYIVSLENVDFTRPVSITFASETEYISKPDSPKNLFNNIEIPVDLKPNISSIVIADENGIEMNMSPIGIFFKESNGFRFGTGTNKIALYYVDGREPVEYEIGILKTTNNDGYDGIIYTNHELIKTEDLVKVEIDDKSFYVK